MCYCSASVWFSPVIAWGSWNPRSSSPFICRTAWLNIDLFRVSERGRTSPKLHLFAGEEGPDVQVISIDRALQKKQLNILLEKRTWNTSGQQKRLGQEFNSPHVYHHSQIWKTHLRGLLYNDITFRKRMGRLHFQFSNGEGEVVNYRALWVPHKEPLDHNMLYLSWLLTRVQLGSRFSIMMCHELKEQGEEKHPINKHVGWLDLLTIVLLGK